MADERFIAVERASAALGELTGGATPRALVVLGSGLGDVVDGMSVAAEAPFDAVPGFARSGVAGHAGRFVFGTMAGTTVLVMCGRLHLYEGHSADRVVLPIRAARLLGCGTLLSTNAAGAVSPSLRVGQLVAIRDHINLTGSNPLVGPGLDALGVRFPPMSAAYSSRLLDLAHTLAAARGIELCDGVYAGVLGPSYETRAEIAYLRGIGADVVGMSTVHEVIAAAHAGMEVAAFSLVSNAAGDTGGTHEAVLDGARNGVPALSSLLTAILAKL